MSDTSSILRRQRRPYSDRVHLPGSDSHTHSFPSSPRATWSIPTACLARAGLEDALPYIAWDWDWATRVHAASLPCLHGSRRFFCALVLFPCRAHSHQCDHALFNTHDRFLWSTPSVAPHPPTLLLCVTCCRGWQSSCPIRGPIVSFGMCRRPPSSPSPLLRVYLVVYVATYTYKVRPGRRARSGKIKQGRPHGL